MSNEKWIAVASAAEVEDDEPFCVKQEGCQIALCRVGGTVYAIDDICTHEYASMSDGFIEGDCIECPLHQAQFHIPTGEARTPPATEDLKTWPVKEEDGQVFVNFAET